MKDHDNDSNDNASEDEVDPHSVGETTTTTSLDNIFNHTKWYLLEEFAEQSNCGSIVDVTKFQLLQQQQQQHQ